jgi:hypothetical protein
MALARSHGARRSLGCSHPRARSSASPTRPCCTTDSSPRIPQSISQREPNRIWRRPGLRSRFANWCLHGIGLRTEPRLGPGVRASGGGVPYALPGVSVSHRYPIRTHARPTRNAPEARQRSAGGSRAGRRSRSPRWFCGRGTRRRGSAAARRRRCGRRFPTPGRRPVSPRASSLCSGPEAASRSAASVIRGALRAAAR